MSSEARMRSVIDDAVRAATEPLHEAVNDLSARLAALEGDGGPSTAQTPKRATSGRTGRGKAQPADAGDSAPQKPADGVPAQRKGGDE